MTTDKNKNDIIIGGTLSRTITKGTTVSGYAFVCYVYRFYILVQFGNCPDSVGVFDFDFIFVRISENNKTFDLFTLYATIPHRSNELLQHCFTITNDRRRSSYLVAGRGTPII